MARLMAFYDEFYNLKNNANTCAILAHLFPFTWLLKSMAVSFVVTRKPL